MNVFKNKQGAMKNKGIIILIVSCCVVFLVMTIALIVKYDCPDCECSACPSCELSCPEQEVCPACSPNITTECPSPICPGICNVSEEQVYQITEQISETKCHPTNLQRVGLFSIIAVLLSLLIAFVDTKSRLASTIGLIAYVCVLIYLVFLRYYDYALYGLFMILAVIVTKLFINNGGKQK